MSAEIIEENEKIRWDCIAHCLNLYWQAYLKEEKLGHTPCERCKHLQVCKSCACPPINFIPTLENRSDIRIHTQKINEP
ncbi:MAG: hypothetical protein E7J99_03670 [Clostridium butyricum]|uniref:hypothetical protein n=1 Tax=Clostridium TaxID=1485 RepID=UPI002258592D|nr:MULTISPECIES: hypothetical protein [unclassified Clostridium]MDU7711228.1 hypothetical protein [Clostridium butyricum]MDU1115292.1 hypothetical protein [Clostridium sp.]MDU1232602.1 hypothetical protein [Clostridium sp.]MDU3091719.1 hypothetical protein [Clostridium sp.]UZT07877.1 hypothetical protein ONV75_08415 [Clostridium sp. LQ25]